MTTDPRLEADLAWLEGMKRNVSLYPTSGPERNARIDRLIARAGSGQTPIPMILHCPSCGLQHVDAPDIYSGKYEAWTNPPHKSHLCRPEDGGCGSIWRPADIPTEGVAEIKTKGSADCIKAPASPVGGDGVHKKLAGQLRIAAASSPLLYLDNTFERNLVLEAARALEALASPVGGDGGAYWFLENLQGEWLVSYSDEPEPRRLIVTRDHTRAWRFSSKFAADECCRQVLSPDHDQTFRPTEHADEPALASPAMEGWVMVPREPTGDTVSAMGAAIWPDLATTERHALINAAYAAMLAAAPPAAIKAAETSDEFDKIIASAQEMGRRIGAKLVIDGPTLAAFRAKSTAIKAEGE